RRARLAGGEADGPDLRERAVDDAVPGGHEPVGRDQRRVATVDVGERLVVRGARRGPARHRAGRRGPGEAGAGPRVRPAPPGARGRAASRSRRSVMRPATPWAARCHGGQTALGVASGSTPNVIAATKPDLIVPALRRLRCSTVLAPCWPV